MDKPTLGKTVAACVNLSLRGYLEYSTDEISDKCRLTQKGVDYIKDQWNKMSREEKIMWYLFISDLDDKMEEMDNE